MAKADDAAKDDKKADAANNMAQGAPKDKSSEDKAPEGQAPEAPQVALDSYLRLCGERADQMAGFAHFARRTVKGKKSMADWAQAFADFNAKAV